MKDQYTPHIKATSADFAKTVLMPGDPLRAKMIAETFLEKIMDTKNSQPFRVIPRGQEFSVSIALLSRISLSGSIDTDEELCPCACRSLHRNSDGY